MLCFMFGVHFHLMIIDKYASDISVNNIELYLNDITLVFSNAINFSNNFSYFVTIMFVFTPFLSIGAS